MNDLVINWAKVRRLLFLYTSNRQHFFNMGFTEGVTTTYIVVVILFPFLLTLWALADVLRREFPDSVQKLIWVLVILFFPFLGPVLYMILGSNSKREFTLKKRDEQFRIE